MSGVEIKPGVWINPDVVAEVKKELDKDSFGRDRGIRYRFEEDKRDYLEKHAYLKERKPQEWEDLLGAYEKESASLPSPTFDDLPKYEKVVVTMLNGSRYVLETDLMETFGILGWDDGVA